MNICENAGTVIKFECDKVYCKYVMVVSLHKKILIDRVSNSYLSEFIIESLPRIVKLEFFRFILVLFA